MKSIELWEALTDLDDELLMKAESMPPKNHSVRRLSLRAAVIAAAILLLAVTAAAVSVSVWFQQDGETITYYDYLVKTLFFRAYDSRVATVHFPLEAQRVDLPDRWVETLTGSWEVFSYDCCYFTGAEVTDDAGNRIRFDGLKEIEGLLGCAFTGSEELDGLIQGAYVTMAVTDPARAEREYWETGTVMPDGLTIYCPFRRDKGNGLDPDLVEYGGLTVYLSCTDGFSQAYASHPVVSAAENQALIESRYVTLEQVEILLLQDQPKPDYASMGFAAWCQDGIGYLVEMKCWRNVADGPIDLLLPYLKNIK